MNRNNTLWWILGGIAAVILIGGGGVAVSDLIVSARGKQYLPTIQAAASANGVPWQIMYAQLDAESAFNPNAVSSAGAQGIAQFMPATAADYGLTNPFDPVASINAEAQYLADLYNQFGTWKAALAAYNWGPGDVQNAMNNYGSNWFSYAPSVTQNYATSIISNSGLQVA